MSFFQGFDLSGVAEIRIRSYTVGPGNTAELHGLGLEVWRAGWTEPELVDVVFEDEAGPTLATAQAVVTLLNRRLRERQDGEG